MFCNLDTKQEDYHKVIYPTWWGTNQIQDFNKNTTGNYRRVVHQVNDDENLRYINEVNSRSKSPDSPSITEVFINKSYNNPSRARSKSFSGNRIDRIVTKSKNKINNKSKLIKKHSNFSNDEDFNYNLKNAESKIRSQVIYDRLMYKNVKQQKDRMNCNKPQEWRYDNHSQYSNKSRTATPERKQNKTNYMISYDKNLKPDLIREKSKEKNMSKRPSRKESERNKPSQDSFKQRNCESENPLPPTDTVETAKFNKENDFHERPQQSPYSPEKEVLSSYEPSERTKSKNI